MTHPNLSGQPGNTVPLNTDNSTDQVRLDYQFTGRMPVTFLSSAQAVNLGASEAGLVVYGGAASGSTVTLPTPEVGLRFDFFADAAATSAAIVIRTGSSNIDMVIGGGNVGSTNTAVGLTTTAAQLGSACVLIGLSTSRWAFIGISAQFSSAYTSDAATTLAALWQQLDSTG